MEILGALQSVFAVIISSLLTENNNIFELKSHAALLAQAGNSSQGSLSIQKYMVYTLTLCQGTGRQSPLLVNAARPLRVLPNSELTRVGTGNADPKCVSLRNVIIDEFVANREDSCPPPHDNALAHEIRSETCLCVNSILSKIPLGTLMLHPHPRHDVQSFQCSKLEGFVREFAFQCQLPTRQLFSVEAWGDGLQDLRLRIFLLLPNVVLLALPFHDDSIILCLYLPPLLLILATVSSACHSSDSLVAGGRHRLHVLARFVEFEPLAIRVPLRYRRWCELRMAEDLSVHRACDVCLMTRAWRGPRFNRARTQSS
ncbi:hypothetical protein LshimejAT787_0310770 [Lyophyllum shimeji]|uniref:Uncharacterized protein n=1 Tax=Lyophyllum shimeji TaxID=47721 RepID=A0A9P3UMI0_LYOSH|nr:hypothetical protein LshimejAT787_0310770 [Lyophyllum shimeji]